MQPEVPGPRLAQNPNPENAIGPELQRLAAALAQLVARKDACTGAHIRRTSELAVRLARELPGMTAEGLERVRLAAILHDVGKIAIEDRILKKGAPLDDEEWEVMRRHPQLGFEMLCGFEGVEAICDGVRFHHERWDGEGYPRRLKGRAIPWIARLIAVVDTYDAMISTRPYREGVSHQVAYREILSMSGTQFDPEMVEAFARGFYLVEVQQTVASILL